MWILYAIPINPRFRSFDHGSYNMQGGGGGVREGEWQEQQETTKTSADVKMNAKETAILNFPKLRGPKTDP